MIKGISAGPGLQVSGNSSSYPYISPGAQSAGMVRYNTSSQCLEVYDGLSWLLMSSSYPTVEFDSQTRQVIEWAHTKMQEEQRLLDLAKEHPTVADALATRQRADEAVKIAATLCNKS